MESCLKIIVPDLVVKIIKVYKRYFTDGASLTSNLVFLNHNLSAFTPLFPIHNSETNSLMLLFILCYCNSIHFTLTNFLHTETFMTSDSCLMKHTPRNALTPIHFFPVDTLHEGSCNFSNRQLYSPETIYLSNYCIAPHIPHLEHPPLGDNTQQLNDTFIPSTSIRIAVCH